ncbi:MAG: DEAD/DEAH box helicase [Betaproteobacteria bacterium]|nr:DEAD/DEAH box helicase [Betaproteobacteria bacterium]
MPAFHPAVAAWFGRAFAAPTPAQLQAWPAIQSGRDTLIAAPTGSGKTLAAFLAAIDDLVRKSADGPLPDETAVVYVSPLKALSNDIRLNLEAPIAGIREELQRLNLPDVEIRTFVRTGDTPQAERNLMKKRAPHIVVTTPESLYILLGSESGRDMLATTRTVIVDEIHAIASSKRGSHLALSLERLDVLAGRRPNRIGLSATQKPIEEVARFLVGATADGAPRECTIIDTGHIRRRDLDVVVPPSPLEAVMSNAVKEEVYEQLTALIREHSTTLIFVNTRRMAERAARHLGERLGKAAVAAHHGSLSREHRLDAEQRLKRGELQVLIATASLELGIDIGDVDLVCQIGSPRSIAAFLQRVGRSGHAVGATPKGRLFPQSRDDLIECTALLDCVRRGELDALIVPHQPLDVLAQQIVAEVACQDWKEDALFALIRQAWPYRAVTQVEFSAVVRMLADGYVTRVGTRGAYLHRDAVNGMLRARRGARLTAITSGGTIPDNADYEVILEPQALRVGTINEDFAIESLAGDIFQLGNVSYRILRVERGRVRVEDAKGVPPNIPFWLGEGAGRSDELSFAVSRFREEIARQLETSPEAALRWLCEDIGLAPAAAQQIVDYLAAARIALGVMPTQRDIVMERFFDESGGTQLVIHSPYGSRINRGWGLALRKRFCRKFNFELQAAATEDSIVLSLSTSHSFPLEEVARYLNSKSVREVLIQAMLVAPMFPARWRWAATTALALPRFRGGKKVPPPIQRMVAEDLLAAVFPDQVACAENLVGERVVPDHPLVTQTVHDCLYQAMDIEGLERLLRAIEAGDVRVIARDTVEASPLAMEVLSAAPYAFLDDAPLEERRTQAVMGRRWLDADSASDLGRLDAAAITRVREEAWPPARSADELHQVLMETEFLTGAELDASERWPEFAAQLAAGRRATWLRAAGKALFIATERLPLFQALYAALTLEPEVAVPVEFAAVAWTREDALVQIARGRLGALGPVTAAALAAPLAVPVPHVDAALIRLEVEGVVMRGRFSPDAGGIEWCDRRLLARIHRYTVKRLRQEIEPVEPRDFMRFLFEWQRVAPGTGVEGPDALAAILAQLEGYEAPAASWESEILPARLKGYDFTWLDDLCLSGRVVWTRLSPPAANPQREHAGGPVRTTPIALLQRRNIGLWTALGRNDHADALPLSARARGLFDYLTRHGASFFDELLGGARLLRSQLEEALGELVAVGLVTSDSFMGLRALLLPSDERNTNARRARRGRRGLLGIDDAGRWSLTRRAAGSLTDAAVPSSAADAVATVPMSAAIGASGTTITGFATAGTRPVAPTIAAKPPQEAVEHIAWTLLKRYGVVCWRMLEREAAWLPPWRDLLRVYHRLEARGEIRGGRFIAGLSGEQFALPDAVGLLRKVRKQPADGALVAICGADPLNLLGSVIPGGKVPALTGARILFRDGVPIATLIAREVSYLEQLGPGEEWAMKKLLLRDHSSLVSSA